MNRDSAELQAERRSTVIVVNERRIAAKQNISITSYIYYFVQSQQVI